MKPTPTFTNPYRPGAGHMPTYLAGREDERTRFSKLLQQTVILENLILTGLRGLGKTVLLETLKPLAIDARWLWVGTDLSEASSLTEERVAVRLLTDIAAVTANLTVGQEQTSTIGYLPKTDKIDVKLNYDTLWSIYQATPGLVSDKLKYVLELIWQAIAFNVTDCRGIIFAYDEAQNMTDHNGDHEFPLSLMLDVFQSLQRKQIPFMLVFAGLPTLFPKLVDARTYAERMFHVMTLDKLDDKERRDAILKPIEDSKCPVKFTKTGVDSIAETSGGYPYFIQFICREAYDTYLQGIKQVSIVDISRKLDADFFMGRWSKITDRQRELLYAIACLPNANFEFTVQDVAASSKENLERAFSCSQTSQTFTKLIAAGLLFKNRHGRYSFAVPMLQEFILRQFQF